MLKILINTAIGIALVWIWLQFVNIKEILGLISRINPAMAVPPLLFMFLSAIIRSLRLKIFLSEVKKIPLWDLTLLNGFAILLNFFIPIRAGELAKGVYLNTKYGLNLGKSIIWIFLDRFVDFLVVLILTPILLLTIPTNLPESFSKTSSFILIFALTLTYLAIFQPVFTKKIINFLRYLLIEKHIKIYFERFSHFILESFVILRRHPKDLALLILVSALAYVSDGAVWYFSFLALGQSQDFIKMFLGQLFSALTYLIPAAPGYVGSAEASGLLILSGVFGIETNLASAMIVLFHITSAIFVLIFGVVSLFLLKIDLGIILRKALKRG